MFIRVNDHKKMKDMSQMHKEREDNQETVYTITG